MTRTGWFVSVFVLVAAGMALSCIGMGFPLEIGFRLVAGWALFLIDVVPRLTLNGSGAATAIVALVMFVIGFHRLATWYMSTIAVADATKSFGPPDWKWRWTFLVTSTMLLMFVAGITVVGLAHQTVWLLASDQPFLANNFIEFQRLDSRSKLALFGKALHDYSDRHGSLPAGGTFDGQGHSQHGWQTVLLPFVDQEPLFSQIDMRMPWSAASNSTAMRTVVPQYLSPSVKSAVTHDQHGRAITCFAANGWLIGGHSSRSFVEIRDGLSNTLLVGEVNTQFKAWGHPVNWRDPMLGINRVPQGFGSPYHFGAHFLLADGAVRWINENIDPAVLKALAIPDGGESVGDF